MSMDYIPPELLIDILTRLPVKTLLRYTSVSKSWHSLITSPSFIATHLNNQRNLNNQTPFLLFRHCTQVEANEDPWIVGTCDGLVCLSSSDIVALWNPSLRKSLILPKPSLQSHGLIPRDIRTCIGFGIHPVTNDCKIVRLTYLRSDRVLVPPKAFLNGVVHWAGRKPKYIFNKSRSRLCTVIMSFDMRNDTLGFVKLVSYDPKSKQIKNINVHGVPSCFHVDTYNESLVLTRGLNEVIGRPENSGDAVTCRTSSVLPREEDEVKGKSTIMKEE
ncbi:hypothetical protein LguiA_022007 [Lonicera macranthoides]